MRGILLLGVLVWANGLLMGAYVTAIYTYWGLVTGRRQLLGFVVLPETSDRLKSVDPLNE